jgi:hypothetical protein
MAVPVKKTTTPSVLNNLNSAVSQYVNQPSTSMLNYPTNNMNDYVSNKLDNYDTSLLGLNTNPNFGDIGQTLDKNSVFGQNATASQSALVDSYLNNMPMSIVNKPYSSMFADSNYTNPDGNTPDPNSALSRYFNNSFNPFNWNWTGKDGLLAPTAPGGKSIVEMGIGGLSSLASLWGAYNQKLYQDKMANLQKRAEDIYEQQVARQNQRQDLAQANYNASFR